MEILFRGFHKCNGPDTAIIDGVAERGRWVYGDPARHEDGAPYIRFWEAGGYQAFQVEKSTVGQWTGLTDKNGKKIFQGDVLKAVYGTESAMFSVKWSKDRAMFGLAGNGFVAFPDLLNDVSLEIAGTIYDAPPEGA